MLIMDHQLLHQKVHQKISVVKTNPCDDVSKKVRFGTLIHILSCVTSLCFDYLLRFFDEFFDVIIDKP